MRIAVLVLLAALVPLTSFALTLDEFNDPQEASAPRGMSVLTGRVASSAIGGKRKMFVNVENSGASNHWLRAQIAEGFLSHSQDATIEGSTTITWDGTTFPTLTPTGLGGIDLLQDDATGFVFRVTSFDFPALRPLPLVVRVYDAADASGTRWSEGRVVLENWILISTEVTLSFSDLTTHGPGGAANLSRAGAIEFSILGAAPNVDLVIEAFKTNGRCATLPDANGRVIDDCGVCGGDGSSCRDCAGTKWGPAVVDRCGECGGDGNSCLGCTSNDQSPLLTALDGGAKKQERILKSLYTQVESNTRAPRILRRTKSLRKKAHRLQIRNWTLSWQLPRVATVCSNVQFCAASDNSYILNEYRKNSDELRRMAVAAVALLQKVKKVRPGAVKRFLTQAEARHQSNMELADRVPLTQSSCA